MFNWESKNTENIIDFPHPGVYLLKAKTFGIKGFLGGTHSWIVHVDSDDNHLVAEITNLEILKVQKATTVETVREPVNNTELLVFISNREGGQTWFGSKPKCRFIGNVNKLSFRNIIISYPLSQNSFNVLNTNCNTFSSWIIYNLGVSPKNIGIGAKSKKRWNNFRNFE